MWPFSCPLAGVASTAALISRVLKNCA